MSQNRDPHAHRIAALAELTGTSVRNIREYQDRGLIAPPQRRGRFAYYDEEHLTRIQLIGRMLARGYTIAVIKELLDAWATGRDLAQVLGVDGSVPKDGAQQASPDEGGGAAAPCSATLSRRHRRPKPPLR